MFVHEDGRRILVEWATGNFKECKVAVMKSPGILGDHWHADKDEVFLLLSGRASQVVIGNKLSLNMVGPCVFEVPRGTYHRFVLEAGSVLLGAATELYDKADERTDNPPVLEEVK